VGIGASIFLIAIGAILAFAVDLNLGSLDLTAVGWILLAVGALGLVMTALIWGRRRTAAAPMVEEREVVERPATYRRVERRDDYNPPL
jgi:hypothetical protein